MIGAPRFEVFFCGLLKPEAAASASVSVTGIEKCLWIGNQRSSLLMQKMFSIGCGLHLSASEFQ